MRRLVLAIVVVAAAGRVAHAAPGGALCTVTEILATNEKKGVDPRLARMKDSLAKPPLSSFDTFKLLGQQDVALERQKPLATRVTYGGLTLIFKDRLTVPGKPRLRVGVDLDDKDGHRKVSTVVVIESGSDVMIAGEKLQGGTYILNLACKAP